MKMPSKKKNSKKTPSKLSNSDQNIDFSSSPAASASISSPLNWSNEQLLSSLDEASAKFPSLISRTAFIGTVEDTVVSDSREDHQCKIWLPESAMGYSIAPDSLVSVSLYSMDKSLDGFPLSALSDECARYFGFDLGNDLADEAGNFFAIATPITSREVSGNRVRLSLDLSYTLGYPASGRTIFVCPVNCPSSENGYNNRHAPAAGDISLDCCKEYKSMMHLKGKVEVEDACSSHLCLSEEVASGQIVNSKISSPKTTYLCHASIDMKELIGNHSSRKIIEPCIMLSLSKRSLLCGNFVVAPVFSWYCVLHIVCCKKLMSNSEIMDTKNNNSPAQNPNIEKDIVPAFSLDSRTKIHWLIRGNPMVETSPSSFLAHPELGPRHIKDRVGVGNSKLGGLSKEFAILKDIIISSTMRDTIASLGLRPTKGVLLHGPQGTGKTTLARVCAHDAGVKVFSVNGPEIISPYHGETEEALRKVFDRASKASPAVVFIDELDVIAPARKEGGDDLSYRIVATLLNLMDGISRTDGMLIIAATNRPDSIEPALRRPGRLDREIKIGVPSPGQRHDILLALLSEMNHSLSDKDIENLAMATHGFVGADLAALSTEAGLVCLRKYANSTRNHGEAALFRTSETQNSSDITDGIRINRTCDLENTLRITLEDFEKARVRIRPSAMREIILEVPKVGWEDVGGQMEVKMQLMEAVQWPQKHKDAFERIGIRPPSGILLFGPPGCSKTLLARAVASEAGLNFLAVKGPELFSKWVGESEKAVRSLFAKARANAPSIIFFDEIDGLATIRGQEGDGVSVGDRVISQLLVELDGLQQRVSITVIAATNRPDNIDPALLRPGRFDRLLYVGPPSKKDREDIFRVHLQGKPCSSDICISELALLTEGCTGADISRICREASMKVMEENFCASEITMEHLKFGIQQVEPSDVRMFEKLSAKFQRLVHSTAKKDDLRCEPCSDKPIHLSFWARIRSALLFLFRLPGFSSL